MRLVLDAVRANVVLALITLALALSQRCIALDRLVVGSFAILGITFRSAVDEAIIAGWRAKDASIFVFQHLVRRLYFPLWPMRGRFLALPDRGPRRCFDVA